MPEPASQKCIADSKPCARCHTAVATLTVRSDPLCRECFIKYVSTKLLKSLEMNKSRGGFHDVMKVLLVPIMFDVSSISLLHALDQQLQRRAEAGRRSGFTLHLLHIDESCINEDCDTQQLSLLLKERFSEYSFSVVRIEDWFSYNDSIGQSIPKEKGPTAGGDLESAAKFHNVISSGHSATSKADLIAIVRRRLIAAFAKKQGCDSVLYGDSTTELAARVLSETSKGRGGFLPSLTSDNAIIDGVVTTYPMRDLLQKELAMYCDVTNPPLTSLIKARDSRPLAVSSKDVTIDGLMAQYFDSVQEAYPSIVANVVRTSSKLAASSDSEKSGICSVCGLAIHDGHWGGEQNGSEILLSQKPVTKQLDHPKLLCYGCVRATEAL